jgi:tRNA (guanine37-N1)-methyltransferase
MNKLGKPHVKVKKGDAEKFINFLKKRKSLELNHRFKVQKNSNYVYFPIHSITDENKSFFENLVNQFELDIVQLEPLKNPNYKFRNIENALEGKISHNYIKYIPKSYDVIGKNAIVEFEKEMDEINDTVSIKKEIAKAIVCVNSSVKNVFQKASNIKGEYRRRDLNLLYGKEQYETLHRENNCQFLLDLRKTFFTPRLVTERSRISSLKYRKDEIVFDLFSGVGTFSIQIAKKNPVKVYAFDINPYAYSYLVRNIKLNSLKEKILPFNIDIKVLILSENLRKLFQDKIDRVVMNLPENSLKFMDVACALLKKKNGIIHNYQFCEKENSLKTALKNIKSNLLENSYKIKRILGKGIVKTYSPTHDMVAVDVLVEKSI